MLLVNILLGFIAFLGTSLIGILIYMWKRRERSQGELVEHITQIRLNLQGLSESMKNQKGWIKSHTKRLNGLNRKVNTQGEQIIRLQEKK